MIIQRSNTILYCRHWQETVVFYRDIFQFVIHYQNEWFVEFQVHSGSYLSIANAERATIQGVDGQGITLAWQVEDIQAIHSSLLEQHITVTEIKQKWGAWVFYLHDPENHRIELWQTVSSN